MSLDGKQTSPCGYHCELQHLKLKLKVSRYQATTIHIGVCITTLYIIFIKTIVVKFELIFIFIFFQMNFIKIFEKLTCSIYSKSLCFANDAKYLKENKINCISNGWANFILKYQFTKFPAISCLLNARF